MTESAFQNAERAFREVLDKLYNASRIDYTTYFYFSTPLENRPSFSLMSEIILKRPHRQVLLDLGCGMGAFETKLHCEKRNIETVGLDLNKEYIRLALLRQRLHGFNEASFIVGDIHSIPFRKGVFDVIVLHDIAFAINLYRVIKEDALVLKNMGILMVDVPMKAFYDIFPVRRPHFIKYTKKGIVNALKTQGFILEQTLLSEVPPSTQKTFHLPPQLIRLLSKIVMALPKPLQKIFSDVWFSTIFWAKMQE